MKRVLVAVLIAGFAVAGAAPAGAAVNRDEVRRAGPIRVLMIGDSLTYFYQDRIQALLGPSYQVVTGGVAGSGLLDANLCDGSRSQLLVNLYDPDIVIAEYTGNYGLLEPLGGPAKCVTTKYGSAKFFNKWGASARKNQKILKSRGARLIWTLVPASTVVNLSGNYKAAVPRLNTIYRKAAPKGTYVDLWTAFGGATYNAALHHPDGLHLSDAGNSLVASRVASAVRG